MWSNFREAACGCRRGVHLASECRRLLVAMLWLYAAHRQLLSRSSRCTDSGGRVTQLQLSQSERLLFVGTESGVLRVHSSPLEVNGSRELVTVPRLGISFPPLRCAELSNLSQSDPLCLQAHRSAISRMCLAHDESYLFTASEDGELLIFELLSSLRDRNRRKEEDGGQELDTVLVSRAELL